MSDLLTLIQFQQMNNTICHINQSSEKYLKLCRKTNFLTSINVETITNEIYEKKREIESKLFNIKYSNILNDIKPFNKSEFISHINNRHDYIIKTIRPSIEKILKDINLSIENCKHTENVISEWYNQVYFILMQL